MAHHKIALLADTHGLLREEVLQKIKDCEVIFHAGDFGGSEIVERLQQIAPVLWHGEIMIKNGQRICPVLSESR